MPASVLRHRSIAGWQKDRCRARDEIGSLVTEENARSDLGALGVLRSDLEVVARGVLTIVVI
jgi:hypothetical protein